MKPDEFKRLLDGLMSHNLTREDANFMANSVAPDAAKKWPTLTAYLSHIYDDFRAGSELYNLLEPRKVVAPGGYHPFKLVSAAASAILYEAGWKHQAGIQPEGVEITAIAVAYQIARYGMQTYFVKEEFARAVAATELPPDFIMDDLHWPMPGMVIGWPPRFLQEMLGVDTCYVFAARFEQGDVYPPPPIRCHTITMPKPKIAWQHYTWEAGHLASYASAYWTQDRVSEAVSKYTYTDYTGRNDEDKNKQDEERTNQLSALMMKLLLVLGMQPHLIETGVQTRKAKVRKGKTRSALWSPNVIGAKYHVVTSGGSGQGTHATPRMHWRRGHVSFVARKKKGKDFLPVGTLPRLENGNIDWAKVTPEQRKLFWDCHQRKWLQPVLVSAPEDK